MTETDKEMMPIPINEFITGVTIPVDVFVRLSESKYVLIAKSGTKTQKEQLATYQNKQVNYLWVKKKEYHKVTRQNMMIAGVVVNHKSISLKQKTHVLSGAAQSVFKELDHVGISIELYNHAKQVTEATVSLVESHNDLAELFESLNECSDDLLRHSMAVSALSTIIGHSMEWENKVTLEKLALGGLLHDIGKKTLPPEILNKSKAKMTYEELQLYETHPFKGMHLLLSLGVVPDDVVSIVYEHHENAIGQGFPQRLRDIKIHPLARVVALANEFVNLTVKNPNCPNPKNPREALIYIEHTMGQPFSKEAFRALRRVIGKEDSKVKLAL